ncbi:MAG: hypothetical protein ACLVJ6_07280 [Merdibacter sp.]
MSPVSEAVLAGGNITIQGGIITAIGGSNASGIGSGTNANGRNITISGGGSSQPVESMVLESGRFDGWQQYRCCRWKPQDLIDFRVPTDGTETMSILQKLMRFPA